MIPRFIRTFLTLSLLVLLPILYFVYQPSTSSSFDSLDTHLEQSIANQKGHWDKGGAMPLGKGWEDEKGRGWGDDDEEQGEYVGGKQNVIAGDGSAPGTGPKQIKQLDMGVSGGVIMGKLKNETAKAELGRAAWKVMHTMTLRFPEHPTADERQALSSYFHLFSRLYPCGECAEEFQALLKDYPPQTSSKKSASLWLCSIHNMVNLRLNKPEFDCNMLEGTYDCGCGDEEGVAADAGAGAGAVKAPGNEEGSQGVKGTVGEEGEDLMEERKDPQPQIIAAAPATEVGGGIKQYDLQDIDEIQDEAEEEAASHPHMPHGGAGSDNAGADGDVDVPPSGRKGSAKWRSIAPDVDADIESEYFTSSSDFDAQPLPLPLPGKLAGNFDDEENDGEREYPTDWGNGGELTVEEILDLGGGYGGEVEA